MNEEHVLLEVAIQEIRAGRGSNRHAGAIALYLEKTQGGTQAEWYTLIKTYIWIDPLGGQINLMDLIKAIKAEAKRREGVK